MRPKTKCAAREEGRGNDKTHLQWSVIIERVLSAVEDDARTLRLTIASELDPAASAIGADPVRIEQIVWNLLSNALKFSPPGGSVTVRLTVYDAFGRLEVIDTGQGIEPDFQQHLFDMFRQAERSLTRTQSGMGIGLALVKQLVEEHGGRVAAESNGLGFGSRFCVWLPLSVPGPISAAASASMSALSGLRVLLVDDAEAALESFAALLSLEGAEVATASNGADALVEMEHHDFDLLVSDVAMPNMDGYQLIAALRQRGRFKLLAAIALTGFGRPQDAQRALAAGFDAHLAKPVVIEEFIQTIKRLPKIALRQPLSGI